MFSETPKIRDKSENVLFSYIFYCLAEKWLDYKTPSVLNHLQYALLVKKSEISQRYSVGSTVEEHLSSL